MERLVTVKDMSERYGCSLPTARKYLRQMFHYERPLAAPQWAFNEWEQSRVAVPAGTKIELVNTIKPGRIIVPRRREG